MISDPHQRPQQPVVQRSPVRHIHLNVHHAQQTSVTKHVNVLFTEDKLDTSALYANILRPKTKSPPDFQPKHNIVQRALYERQEPRSKILVNTHVRVEKKNVRESVESTNDKNVDIFDLDQGGVTAAFVRSKQGAGKTGNKTNKEKKSRPNTRNSKDFHPFTMPEDKSGEFLDPDSQQALHNYVSRQIHGTDSNQEEGYFGCESYSRPDPETQAASRIVSEQSQAGLTISVAQSSTQQNDELEGGLQAPMLHIGSNCPSIQVGLPDEPDESILQQNSKFPATSRGGELSIDFCGNASSLILQQQQTSIAHNSISRTNDSCSDGGLGTLPAAQYRANNMNAPKTFRGIGQEKKIRNLVRGVPACTHSPFPGTSVNSNSPRSQPKVQLGIFGATRQCCREKILKQMKINQKGNNNKQVLVRDGNHQQPPVKVFQANSQMIDLSAIDQVVHQNRQLIEPLQIAAENHRRLNARVQETSPVHSRIQQFLPQTAGPVLIDHSGQVSLPHTDSLMMQIGSVLEGFESLNKTPDNHWKQFQHRGSARNRVAGFLPHKGSKTTMHHSTYNPDTSQSSINNPRPFQRLNSTTISHKNQDKKQTSNSQMSKRPQAARTALELAIRKTSYVTVSSTPSALRTIQLRKNSQVPVPQRLLQMPGEMHKWQSLQNAEMLNETRQLGHLTPEGSPPKLQTAYRHQQSNENINEENEQLRQITPTIWQQHERIRVAKQPTRQGIESMYQSDAQDFDDDQTETLKSNRPPSGDLVPQHILVLQARNNINRAKTSNEVSGQTPRGQETTELFGYDAELTKTTQMQFEIRRLSQNSPPKALVTQISQPRVKTPKNHSSRKVIASRKRSQNEMNFDLNKVMDSQKGSAKRSSLQGNISTKHQNIKYDSSNHSRASTPIPTKDRGQFDQLDAFIEASKKDELSPREVKKVGGSGEVKGEVVGVKSKYAPIPLCNFITIQDQTSLSRCMTQMATRSKAVASVILPTDVRIRKYGGMTAAKDVRNNSILSWKEPRGPQRAILNLTGEQSTLNPTNKKLINLAKKKQYREQPRAFQTSKLVSQAQLVHNKLPMKSPRNPIQLMKINRNIERFADLWAKVPAKI